jgi:hypothetical protein
MVRLSTLLAGRSPLFDISSEQNTQSSFSFNLNLAVSEADGPSLRPNQLTPLVGEQ